MKYIYLILLVFCQTLLMQSQNYVDLLRVSVNTTPENQFDSSASTTKANEIYADLTLPIKLNEKRSLVTGVIYESTKARLFPEDEIKSFGSVTLKLGINQVFDDKWSGTLVLLPKIASDFKSIGSKDFQIGAIGILKRRKNENLLYKVGLYYNSELFAPFFVPMLGFYYLSPNKKLEANVMAPLLTDINYKVIPFLNIGVYYSGLVRSYHLHDVTPQIKDSYVAKWSNEAYLYFKLNITRSLNVHLNVGHSIGRHYRVYAIDDRVKLGLPASHVGEWVEQLNTDFADGLLYRVVFIYRFHLD